MYEKHVRATVHHGNPGVHLSIYVYIIYDYVRARVCVCVSKVKKMSKKTMLHCTILFNSFE